MKGSEQLRTYLDIPRINNLFTRVREAFQAKRLLGHGWDHIRRDIINAAVIGTREQANMDIVLPATILHDIGFLYDPEPTVEF